MKHVQKEGKYPEITIAEETICKLRKDNTKTGLNVQIQTLVDEMAGVHQLIDHLSAVTIQTSKALNTAAYILTRLQTFYSSDPIIKEVFDEIGDTNPAATLLKASFPLSSLNHLALERINLAMINNRELFHKDCLDIPVSELVKDIE